MERKRRRQHLTPSGERLEVMEGVLRRVEAAGGGSARLIAHAQRQLSEVRTPAPRTRTDDGTDARRRL
ncbi:hypothetical protein EYF80_067156 [Liparis tanakae]|uniref:Uncharacterized protein n=1 Tax=Liparis tanakae TaxID=230148 RepID=A0A4Z2E2X7_9TELE|nr:hypothetical protein EYF80_067156 [Liparis tanakae]